MLRTELRNDAQNRVEKLRFDLHEYGYLVTDPDFTEISQSIRIIIQEFSLTEFSKKNNEIKNNFQNIVMDMTSTKTMYEKDILNIQERFMLINNSFQMKNILEKNGKLINFEKVRKTLKKLKISSFNEIPNMIKILIPMLKNVLDDIEEEVEVEGEEGSTAPLPLLRKKMRDCMNEMEMELLKNESALEGAVQAIRSLNTLSPVRLPVRARVLMDKRGLDLSMSRSIRGINENNQMLEYRSNMVIKSFQSNNDNINDGNNTCDDFGDVESKDNDVMNSSYKNKNDNKDNNKIINKTNKNNKNNSNNSNNSKLLNSSFNTIQLQYWLNTLELIFFSSELPSKIIKYCEIGINSLNEKLNCNKILDSEIITNSEEILKNLNSKYLEITDETILFLENQLKYNNSCITYIIQFFEKLAVLTESHRKTRKEIHENTELEFIELKENYINEIENKEKEFLIYCKTLKESSDFDISNINFDNILDLLLNIDKNYRIYHEKSCFIADKNPLFLIDDYKTFLVNLAGIFSMTPDYDHSLNLKFDQIYDNTIIWNNHIFNENPEILSNIKKREIKIIKEKEIENIIKINEILPIINNSGKEKKNGKKNSVEETLTKSGKSKNSVTAIINTEIVVEPEIIEIFYESLNIQKEIKNNDNNCRENSRSKNNKKDVNNSNENTDNNNNEKISHFLSFDEYKENLSFSNTTKNDNKKDEKINSNNNDNDNEKMTPSSYAGIYKISTTVQEMIAEQFKFNSSLELNKIDIETGKMGGDLGSEIPVSPVDRKEKRKGKGKIEEEKGKEKEENRMNCHDEFFWLSNDVSRTIIIVLSIILY